MHPRTWLLNASASRTHSRPRYALAAFFALVAVVYTTYLAVDTQSFLNGIEFHREVVWAWFAVVVAIGLGWSLVALRRGPKAVVGDRLITAGSVGATLR